MLNVILVNHNNYLGKGDYYVERLAHGIFRNLRLPYQLHIMTEKDVPQGIEGWWSKIALFEPGRFDGRCLYFDLDTVICGSLDDVAAYDGDFAGISDFYHPRLVQSGVMAWDAGRNTDIWTKWVAAGMPQFHPNGDGGWINGMRGNADILQKMYPGQVVSFKTDCLDGIPQEARVICFHGLPRPHTLRDVMDHF